MNITEQEIIKNINIALSGVCNYTSDENYASIEKIYLERYFRFIFKSKGQYTTIRI